MEIVKRLGRAVCAFGVMLGVVWSATPTPATATELSPVYERCMDRSEGVTVEMLNCIDAETTAHDKRLNVAFQNLLKTAPEHAATLRTAQRAWIAFRDADCDLDSAPEDGGTLGTVIHASCYLEKTRSRADELEETLTAWSEGQ